MAELTLLYEGDPASFRVRAYENAVHELEMVRDDLAAMSVAELQKLDGVGRGTAEKIREYFTTGRIAKLDELRALFPPSYRELTKIPGLGPKTLARLRAELGIESVADLRAAIDQGRLRELPRFGKKREEQLARALDRLGNR